MKKRIIGIIVVLVVVAGAVLGVTLIRKGKNGVVKYRTEPVGRGNIEALVVTSGTLNPIDLVDVGSQVSGKIDKLYADFNSQVTQGQIVAELDLEPLQMRIQQNEANYQSRVAALDRAKVNLTNLKSKYDRSLSLFDKKLISFEEKEAAEAAYLSAKTDVTSAEASLSQAKSTLDLSKVDLNNAVIRSPVDGTVITRKVSVGQTIQASYQAPVLFQVATDLTKMKVECDVDEADIGKLKEGQKVRFTVEAFPNETFNGVVQQVRYASQTVSNVVTYTTVVNVENPEKKLRPGMTATVTVIVGEANNAIRVPNAALRFTPPVAVLDQLMKEQAERMKAMGGPGEKPGAQQPGDMQFGGPQGAAPQGGQAQGGQAQNFQFRAVGGQGFPGMGGRPGAGGQRRQPSRVFVLGDDGKVKMLFIRAGLTDNSYTEVLRSELKEGDKVITGFEGTGPSTAPQMGGRGPGNMMFIGR